MSVRVVSSVNNIVLQDGNDIGIDFAAWHMKANGGEGGYDLGEIFIENKSGFITIKISTRQTAKRGLVKVVRRVELK